MSSPAPQIQVRDSLAFPRDADFIIATFDSVLPYLEAMGSGGQWGSQLFSERQGFSDSMREFVTDSEKYRLTGEGEATRVFIAEVEVDPAGAEQHGDDEKAAGLYYRYADEPPAAPSIATTTEGLPRRHLQLGFMVVKERWFPGYVKKQPQLESVIAAASTDGGGGSGSWVYIEVLISDYRTGPARKGAGAVLVRRAQEYAAALGARTLFVDCWAGNGEKLVRFYESCGFEPVDDFILERGEKGPWAGRLLRMEL